MPATPKNPAVGPDPPAGRTQPTRGRDEEMEDNDEDDDDDDDSGDDDMSYRDGTLFGKTKDKVLVGLLMELVRKDRRDTVYYVVDELVQRL